MKNKSKLNYTIINGMKFIKSELHSLNEVWDKETVKLLEGVESFEK